MKEVWSLVGILAVSALMSACMVIGLVTVLGWIIAAVTG